MFSLLHLAIIYCNLIAYKDYIVYTTASKLVEGFALTCDMHEYLAAPTLIPWNETAISLKSFKTFFVMNYWRLLQMIISLKFDRSVRS